MNPRVSLTPTRQQTFSFFKRGVAMLPEISDAEFHFFVGDDAAAFKCLSTRRDVTIFADREFAAAKFSELRNAQHTSAASAANDYRASFFLHHAGKQLRAAP